MGKTSIRWEAVTKIAELIQLNPLASGVDVTRFFAGDEQGRESICFASVHGDVTNPVAQANRLQREDDFTLVWEIRTADHDGVDEAMARLYELVSIFDEILADAPSLDDLDGVLWAHFDGIQKEIPVNTPAGFTAFAEVSIQVQSRLV